jgi:CubicO group peptidase (beta-lactamase class C family)
MRQIRFAPLAALVLLFHSAALAKETAVPALVAQMDAVASSYFKDDEPGAAVLVMKDGKPLLRKGYGLADVELGVKMQPDHVLRTGSITKQFTAVAILQLVEQGKIALDDPITRVFPDYPMQGKTITIEHLLTHTSGIQSYTDKPNFLSTIRTDFTPQQLIDSFKNDPMKSAPGERYAYNNSAYVILGAIIEKISGQSYADYMRTNVIERAGLKQTYYDDTISIIPRRAAGYDRVNGKVVNARFTSMTLPYSAGAIASTVDDLAKWMDAVAAGKLVSLDLLKRAWTPYKLTSGELTTYGYGWGVNELLGHRTIQHGGGIMGFSAYAMWLPDDKVYVAVLSNTEEPPVSVSHLARQLASFAIGKPWNPVEITMTEAQLREYVGIYRVDDKTTRTVTFEDGRLHSQRSDGPKLVIRPRARDEFFFDESFTTLSFERGADGKLAAMILNDGKVSRAVRTDEKVAERVFVTIAPEKLDRYVGRYQVTPELIITVSRKGNELFGQARGPREIQMFAESEAKWFLKEVSAQLTFEFDASGKANRLTLQQNGRNLTGDRIAE